MASAIFSDWTASLRIFLSARAFLRDILIDNMGSIYYHFPLKFDYVKKIWRRMILNKAEMRVKELVLKARKLCRPMRFLVKLGLLPRGESNLSFLLSLVILCM